MRYNRSRSHENSIVPYRQNKARLRRGRVRIPRENNGVCSPVQRTICYPVPVWHVLDARLPASAKSTWARARSAEIFRAPARTPFRPRVPPNPEMVPPARRPLCPLLSVHGLVCSRPAAVPVHAASATTTRLVFVPSELLSVIGSVPRRRQPVHNLRRTRESPRTCCLRTVVQALYERSCRASKTVCRNDLSMFNICPDNEVSCRATRRVMSARSPGMFARSILVRIVVACASSFTCGPAAFVVPSSRPTLRGADLFTMDAEYLCHLSVLLAHNGDLLPHRRRSRYAVVLSAPRCSRGPDVGSTHLFCCS